MWLYYRGEAIKSVVEKVEIFTTGQVVKLVVVEVISNTVSTTVNLFLLLLEIFYQLSLSCSCILLQIYRNEKILILIL